MYDPIELIAAREDPNVRAFLRMLRHGEGTSAEDGYQVMFGGGRFDSFADHPRQVITRALGGTMISSTAAGAYQFLSKTWDGLVSQYRFADFSPTNQDLGAIALIKGRKAQDDVIAGRFETAVMKCNREWASLPGSPYGQPVVTMARARKEYEAAGGAYEAAQTASTEPLYILDQGEAQHIASTQPTKEPAMAPFIAAALPALIDLVPKLGAMFSSGSETSQRNVKAAEIVVAAAKEAIGARNEQELIETIKADPAAAAMVKTAVEQKWFDITEVGGGIEAARVANEKASAPDAAPLHKNPAFFATLLLMPLVYLVVTAVLFTGNFNDDVKTMVIGSIVTGVLGAVTGFWLGTSFGSQRKTDMLAK